MDRAWSALVMELQNSAAGMSAGEFAPAAFSSSISGRGRGGGGRGGDGVGNEANEEKETTGAERRRLDRIRRDSNPANYGDDYFMERLRHRTHEERGDYAGGLRRWLRVFGDDVGLADREHKSRHGGGDGGKNRKMANKQTQRLLIVNFKDISRRPKEVLHRVCSHIGVKYQHLANALGEDEISKKYNAREGAVASSTTDGNGNVRTRTDILRPSLRRKMEEHLRPRAKEFNGLLEELGYGWRVDEYVH